MSVGTLFFVNEKNIEPNSEVSADQVGGRGDTMSPSANAAARRKHTGRVRPEGSVQVRKLAIIKGICIIVGTLFFLLLKKILNRIAK